MCGLEVGCVKRARRDLLRGLGFSQTEGSLRGSGFSQAEDSLRGSGFSQTEDGMRCRTSRDIAKMFLIAIMMLLFIVWPSLLAFGVPSAQAEGTCDLVADGGYRPYTERYNSSTLGQQRLSVMHVYLNAGETAYFGTSVADAKLYETNDNKNSDWLFSNTAMGTSYSDEQLAYVNTADIYITQGEYSTIADAIGAGKTPGKDGVTLIDLDNAATSSTPGYIYNSTQEAGGVDMTGLGAGYKVTSDNTISTSTAGYVAGVKTNANTFTAPSNGIYTVVFFSQKHSGENPTKTKFSDTMAFKTLQKGGTIASWDISVYSGSTLQTGRVFTSALFINMGGNVLSNGVSKGSLYSTVYAVTDDGYQYSVDFNGMDPFGFVFFANNRGLLSTVDGSSSLYHGVRSEDNTLSDVADHGIALNNMPYDDDLDHTYNLFYETPSSDALGALNIGNPSAGAGGISKFTFAGTGDATADQGYVGKGGTFSFDASSDISATSYQIELDFSAIGGGTVVLSNALAKGATNSISWDGKDANGNVVPAGTYGTLNASIKLKGGEVHFPLLDVEQNPNGIIITRLNGNDPDSMVYFNNSAANAGDTSAPWTVAKNWQVGSEVDATTGVDSSAGAMAFTNANTVNNAKGKTLLGDGDQCALDLWAYYNTTASLGTWTFSLVDPDASFTVTKVWDNTAGTPAAGNPVSVTMTLQQSSDGGTTWSTVTTDGSSAAITNPVKYDTSASASYTWQKLDASKTYRVQETSVTGYTTAYGDVGNVVIADTGATVFSQTVTNAYTPTKLTISKVWNHGSTDEEPEAYWPTSVTIHVYTDAAKTHEIAGSPFMLTAASKDESGNAWAQTITGLDSTLSYYCFEDPVTGYTSSSGGQASGDAANGYKASFTNTFDSTSFVTAQVLKQWSGDIIDGISYRPSSVEMTLVNKDTGDKITTDGLGHNIDNPVNLTAATSWYYTWSMLPKKDANGNTINYRIVETVPAGYTATTEPADPPLVLGNLTSVIWDNAYQTTSFSVTKSWANGINDANQPGSATVQLQQSVDGGATYNDYGSPVMLTKDSTDAAGDPWANTWTGLPSYTADGQQILYRATESAVDGYTTTYGDVGEATTDPDHDWTIADGYKQSITNTYKYTNITVTKVWNHGTQAESDWPQSVNVVLRDTQGVVATGVLDADDNWSYTFGDVPIPDAGETTDGVYTVAEEDVENYAGEANPLSGSDGEGWTVELDNTYALSSLKVTKVWAGDDAANRPTSVTMDVYSDSNKTNLVDSYTLTAADTDADGNWSHTFTGIDPKLTYYVFEDPVPAGYDVSGDGAVSGDATSGFTSTITNTLVPTTFTVTKVWDFGTQAEAHRPTSIAVQLQQSVDGGTTYSNYGDKIILTTANATDATTWVYTWQNLPAFTAAGASVLYKAVEDAVAGYTTDQGTPSIGESDGVWSQVITNTYVPTTLKVTKIWNNGLNANQPGSVTMNVYTDTAKTDLVYTYDLTAADVDEDGNWSHTFADVDPTLTYYVYESQVTGYTAGGEGAVDGDAADGYTAVVTNTFNDADYKTVAVKKTWDMSGVDVSYRPKSIQMTLLDANGDKVTTDALGNTIENPVTLSDANGWYYAWNVLPLGQTYDVEEADTSGYVSVESAPIVVSTAGSSSASAIGATSSAASPSGTVVASAAEMPSGTETQSSTEASSAAVAASGTEPQGVVEPQGAEEAASTAEPLAALGTGSVLSAQADEMPDGTASDGVPADATDGATGGAASDDAAGGTTDGGATDGTASDGTDGDMPSDGTGSADAPSPAAASPSTSGGSAAANGRSTSSALQPEAAGDVEEIDITNTYLPTTFSLTKVWNHGDNTDAAKQPASIVIQLQQSVDSGKTYSDYGDKVTLTSANADASGNWTYEWTTLPSVLGDGTQVLYRAVEASVTGYTTDQGTATYTPSLDEGSMGTWAQTITNTYTPTPTPTPPTPTPTPSTPGTVTPPATPATPTVLPRTGDIVRIWTIVGVTVAVVAIVLIVIAIVRSRKKGKQK